MPEISESCLHGFSCFCYVQVLKLCLVLFLNSKYNCLKLNTISIFKDRRNVLILLNTFLGVVAEIHRRSRGGSAPHNLYFFHRLAILIDRPHRFDFDVDSDSMLRSCGGGVCFNLRSISAFFDLLSPACTI